MICSNKVVEKVIYLDLTTCTLGSLPTLTRNHSVNVTFGPSVAQKEVGNTPQHTKSMRFKISIGKIWIMEL